MAQKTLTKDKATTKKKTDLKSVQEEFVKEKARETHRVVTLSYKSCCGCGCDYKDIIRTVPFDSKLKDGDKVTSLERGDKMVDR